MFAFSVRRDVAYTTRHGYRSLRAVEGREIAAADIVVAVGGEPRHAQRAVDAAERAAAGLPRELDPPLPDHIRGLRRHSEASLRTWRHFPVRLGRRSFGADDKPIEIAEPAPLAGQLAALRERRPRGRHLRLAIVNGFGGNLGDTMIGATAWRQALPVLRAALPGFAADVLLGPDSQAAAAGLIGPEEGIGQVLLRGPSLQDFARYDAFFDFDGLIDLPGFATGAHVDWVLWWLGLDPESIPGIAKRNRLHLPQAAWDWAGERLSGRPGLKLAFVWRASVPLRSMPDPTAQRFALALLDAAPGITLVTDWALGLDHPRVLDLGGEANSPERMMALVARCDALIGVDSLAQHVADAADLPCVMLSASLPPSRFAYYPNTRIVTPPGMDRLPGWGLTKLPEAKFAGHRDDYARAWDAVSAEACWRLLEDRIAQRSRRPQQESGIVVAAPSKLDARPAAGLPFPHDVRRPLDQAIDEEMRHVAGLVLRPGHTVVLAGGYGFAAELARLVAPAGALHVLEARRLRAQALVAEVVGLGLETLHLHGVAAAAAAATGIVIPDLDPASETDPADVGNLLATTKVAAVALDDLGLRDCGLVILRPPQDPLGALRGATLLLRTLRPVLLIGPVNRSELTAIDALLAPSGYGCWVLWGVRTGPGAALCLATPTEAQFGVGGFERYRP